MFPVGVDVEQRRAGLHRIRTLKDLMVSVTRIRASMVAVGGGLVVSGQETLLYVLVTHCSLLLNCLFHCAAVISR